MSTTHSVQYHEAQDIYIQGFGTRKTANDVEFTYKFDNFFHPFIGELIEKLNKESLPGMLDAQFHESLSADFFKSFYETLTDQLVKVEYSDKDIDIQEGGPYANYNWELLFHIPLTIAVHLSKNQRFAEAQKWFHFIFDPTCNDKSIPAPDRYWKFIAFRNNRDATRIDEWLRLLSKPELSAEEAELRTQILNGIEAVRHKPFQPHAVARTRRISYQYYVLMKYLDNLIAWGDNLFRQDTVESINEASMRYVLAANLLGRKPQRIPSRGGGRPQTFAQLKAQGLDAMGNALVELESKFPFNMSIPSSGSGEEDVSGPLFGIGRTLYFCIPHNEHLLKYWDTVADRLFKIRNSMNIDGIVRKLALFDPPIDPGMLVKAAAAGIDIGSVINGLNQPVGSTRAMVYIQKALELCSEIRSLGASLLSAIEKEDSEKLALMRQSHEIKIHEMVKEVRYLQWKQAEQSTKALIAGRSAALERYRYYQRLLGRDNGNVPDELPLNRGIMTEDNFDEMYEALVGTYEQEIPGAEYPRLNLAGGSPASSAGASGQGRLYLNVNEDAELNKHLPTARNSRLAASVADTLASVLTFIPEININLHFWGVGGSSKVAGGSKLSDAAKIAAEIARTVANWESDQAGMASRTASYERRADEWMLQYNSAAHELAQTGKQIIGSLIAEQIHYREYTNVVQQIEHAREADQFLRDKFTNAELYGWMQGEISRLYYEYYRFAFDTARKAEQTVKHELMRSNLNDTDFIKFNYWDGGRKGLLSGEALHLDVKRLEMAYIENNKREYELTKHVSLRQLHPTALLQLKATGSCEVSIPEWLFDLDCPGHYMRRIKHVSVSIPSVTGPYTSVNCTLSLLKSSLRISSAVGDDYSREGSEDARFLDYYGAIPSVVTSSGSQDSGMFEVNLNGEKFLPFEGYGAISTWKLELPAVYRQFDYNTIADLILHIQYTARQGGERLRSGAVEAIEELTANSNAAGLNLMFSLKHDFPGEWHRFVVGEDDFLAQIKRDYFPYVTQGRTIQVEGIQLHGIQPGSIQTMSVSVPDRASLSDQLNDERIMSLQLPEDEEVLRRDSQANVFVVLQYTME